MFNTYFFKAEIERLKAERDEMINRFNKISTQVSSDIAAYNGAIHYAEQMAEKAGDIESAQDCEEQTIVDSVNE